MSTLENKLHTGAVWMLVTRACVKGLGLVSSLILVRLLTPEDFGVVAIAMTIYAFIELFGLFGFTTAIIQKTNPTKNDYDTSFTMNFIFGCISSLILYSSAGYLSQFFNDLRLKEVFHCISFLFLIQGLKNIKVVDFQKNMTFKEELKLQLLPKFFSFFVTIYLAFILENYFALIYGMLFNAIFTIVYSYYILPYKPVFKLEGCAELFNFSKWLMINNFLDYVNNKSLDLIVGKLISTKAAGLYTISQEMASLPVTEIGAPINRASFPAYSKAKDNFIELNHLFYKTCSMITFLALPAALGLYSVSEYFVPVVLGDKWVGAIGVIQLLSIAAFISSLSANNGYVFIAIGKPKITTLISGIRILVFLLILFVFTSFEDISSPALALLYSSIVNFFISFSLIKFAINSSFLCVLNVLYRPIVSSLMMCLIIFLFKTFVNIKVDFYSLGGLILLGGFVYISCIYILWVAANKPDSIEKIIFKFFYRGC